MRRALVLGGGGPIGIAWETGLVGGLRSEGVDLCRADVVVGTSAGSVVGARVAAGHDLAADPLGGGRLGMPRPTGGFDRDRMREIFAIWNEATSPEAMDGARRRRIGALARDARTAPLDAWIAASGGATGVADWPARALVLVAIDTASGERCALDAASGAPLARAVAASCAVPGMFPVVPIGARAFMDGGVGSATNADLVLAHAPDAVLVVAPMCDRTVPAGTCAERCVEREARALEAAGARVAVVLPDADDARAFGPDLLNPMRVGSALARGVERGRALAAALAPLWAR